MRSRCVVALTIGFAAWIWTVDEIAIKVMPSGDRVVTTARVVGFADAPFY